VPVEQSVLLHNAVNMGGVANEVVLFAARNTASVAPMREVVDTHDFIHETDFLLCRKR
jgi:hypothetical protein